MRRPFRLWFALLGLLWIILPSFAGRVLNDALVTRPFDHHVWQEVIVHNLNGRGDIDMVQLRGEPRRLNVYLKQLAAVSPDSAPDYFPGRDDRLAYWINAHNALALRLVLNRYPDKELVDPAAFVNETRYRLGGKPYSLLMIRRKVASDFSRRPEAILALSDFTQGMPSLASQAYQGATLETQLTENARRVATEAPLVVVTHDNPACPGLKLNPVLRDYAAVLLSPDIADSEDRDAIPGEEAEPPAAPKTWLSVLRPLLPKEELPALDRQCPHAIEFMPPRSGIRQRHMP